MAEKKITRSTSTASAPVTKKSTAGLRIGAVISWLAALACEVVAILIVAEKIAVPETKKIMFFVIALVVDLVLVILGSRLWVAANHINPASEKNKVAFFLYNNMGVIVCTICFIPFIIVALLDKKSDKKTKIVATAVAAVCLLIGGLGSADWDPVSAEQQTAEREALVGREVYWTKGGKKYHTSQDCNALSKSEELVVGTVAQAIDEGKDNLCKFCAKRDEINPQTVNATSVTDEAKNAIDAAKDAASEAVDTAKDAVNSAKDAVNGLLNN